MYLTQKPLISSTPDAAFESSEPQSQNSPQILIRATNGLSKPHRTAKSNPKQKVKLATVVDAEELEAFYTRYAEVCKKGMEGLRKRDKKKAKEKAKAKKKGKATGAGTAAGGA